MSSSLIGKNNHDKNIGEKCECICDPLIRLELVNQASNYQHAEGLRS